MKKILIFSDEEIQGMDVQIADQSGKPLQLPPAEKRVKNFISPKCVNVDFILVLRQLHV